MTDLVKELRALTEWFAGDYGYNQARTCNSAADEIEAIRAENARLKGALEFYADDANWRLNGACDPNSGNFEGISRARALLRSSTETDG